MDDTAGIDFVTLILLSAALKLFDRMPELRLVGGPSGLVCFGLRLFASAGLCEDVGLLSALVDEDEVRRFDLDLASEVASDFDLSVLRGFCKDRMVVVNLDLDAAFGKVCFSELPDTPVSPSSS